MVMGVDMLRCCTKSPTKTQLLDCVSIDKVNMDLIFYTLSHEYRVGGKSIFMVVIH